MVLAERARRAAATLAGAEYARIVALTTADGLAAAGILSLALLREGVDFHIQFRQVGDDAFSEDLVAEHVEHTVFVGLGAGERDILAPLGSSAIILDPAATTPGDWESVHVGDVEDREGGVDDASVAAIAYLVARDMAPANRNLYPLALAGAVSEGHVGFAVTRGLDGELLSEALEQRVIAYGSRFPFGDGPLIEHLAQSIDPYIPGLAGRARNVKRFLEAGGSAAGPGPEADAAKMDVAERARLMSRVALHVVSTAAGKRTPDLLLAPRFESPTPFLGTRSVAHMVRALDAAVAFGKPGDAMESLLTNQYPTDRVATLPGQVIRMLMRAEREAESSPVVLMKAASPGMGTVVAARAARYAIPPASVAVAVSHSADGQDAIVDARASNPARPLSVSVGEAAKAVDAVAWGRRHSARVRMAAGKTEAFMAALREAVGVPVEESP